MKNFTSGALFHLRDTDIGRPITELVRRLDYDRLQEEADTLLRELTVVEREVTLDDGTTFIMSLRLYRTVTQVIDGVIIIFSTSASASAMKFSVSMPGWPRSWRGRTMPPPARMRKAGSPAGIQRPSVSSATVRTRRSASRCTALPLADGHVHVD